MSLHQLAKQVQSKGRGKDRMLMHVTPREVAGLQAIAKANGGSLTVNPDTGLVEAGFLDNILPTLLPMAAGAALTIGSGGALSPLAAAMITGGGYGLATGSVEKGLMAGLGAYGGAGLAGSLGTAGANVVASPEAVAGQLGVPGAATGPGSQAALLAEQNAGFGAEGLKGISNAAATATPTPAVPQFDGSVIPQGPAMGAQAPVPTYAQQVQAGAQNQFSTADKATDFLGQNYGKIGMAAAPTLSAAMEPKPFEEPEVEYSKNALRLSPDFKGYTPARPDPYYRPTGLGYAMGGPVDPMQQMPNGGLAAIQTMRDGYGAAQTMDGNIPQFAEGGDVKKKESSPQLPTSGGDGFGKVANLTVNALEGRSPPNDPVARLVNAMRGKFGSQPQAVVTGNSLEYQIDPRIGAVYVPRGLGYEGYAMGGNIPQFAEGGVPKKPSKATRTGARNLASMDAYEAALAELNNARAGANMSKMNMPRGGIAELGALPYAAGGIAGGRYLNGGGDGMSDSIPATINNKQPARLADGEFVVPADVVSHLGNGSSNAGAKKLYGMMDKIRTARTGKKKQAPAVKTDKYMPA